ncbi:MAG: hypothetical protein IJ587_05160 [Synergistaceae bacterium]|nr:hypothetical protein [Synergistaceae bacterium]
MRTRLSISERAEILRECTEKLQKLTVEFEGLLTEKFAPYDARNFGADYSVEDRKKKTSPYDDIDTPLMQGIFDVLYEAYEKLQAKCDKAEGNEERREEAELMFQAWELGLCPYVMREYRWKYAEIPYVWNTSCWEEIAELLENYGMSADDTRNAVETWLAMRTGEQRKTA